MRKNQKGSLTIEATVIIPIALFVIGVLLYSFFYYHDKNILAAAAYETAVYGSYAEKPTEEMLKEHMENRIWGRLLLFSNIQNDVEIQKDKIEVACQAQKGPMSLKVCLGVKRTEPEEYIRAIRKMNKIGEKE